MSREIHVAVFAEDNAHEQFVTAMIKRLARESGLTADVSVISGRGGHGQALREFRTYQLALKKQERTSEMLVVAIDANCKGWNTMRSEIDAYIDRSLFTACAIACPDPHVERWYLADPAALMTHFGANPRMPRKKCGRDVYKRLLIDSLIDAGQVVTLGGAEFAQEIVDAMDLYQSSRADPSLKSFVDSVRGHFRAVGGHGVD